MNKIKTIALSLIVSSSLSAYDYTLELFSGLVANMNEDVTYRLSGQDDLHLDNMSLSTKPFTVPMYYGIRFSVWDEDDSAWEFEHIHQKLYMDDDALTAPLEHWEMTDGFNFFFVNKAWKLDDYWDGLILRVGTGLVISHPDITYDGEHYTGSGGGAITYGGGYDLSGFVWQVSTQKTFDITENWFLSLETRLTYARAWAQDENSGISDLQNRAFHLNFGGGYRF